MSTIFGLASAAGRSGISVFRVSGPGIDVVWNKLTNNKPLPPARLATLTRLYDEESHLIDHQSVALRFVEPFSFTGENTLELHVHGSRAVQHALVERLATIDSDVRLAHPGEFTRRAFENGKMSLTEVEGLSDLIQVSGRCVVLFKSQHLV
jgi:tRNA modification GTPase